MDEKNRDQLLKAARTAHKALEPWRRLRKELMRQRLAQIGRDYTTK